LHKKKIGVDPSFCIMTLGHQHPSSLFYFIGFFSLSVNYFHLNGN